MKVPALFFLVLLAVPSRAAQWKGKLGSIVLPEGYVGKVIAKDGNETLQIYGTGKEQGKKKAEIQLMPYGRNLQTVMENLAGDYVKKHKLKGADFTLEKTGDDGWILDRMKPTFIRHIGKEGDLSQAVLASPDKALADQLAAKLVLPSDPEPRDKAKCLGGKSRVCPRGCYLGPSKCHGAACTKDLICREKGYSPSR